MAADMPAACSDKEQVDARGGDDFGSLITQARQAHNFEVRCLQDEVRSLREELRAATRGDGRSPRAGAPGGRADPPEDLPPDVNHVDLRTSELSPKMPRRSDVSHDAAPQSSELPATTAIRVDASYLHPRWTMRSATPSRNLARNSSGSERAESRTSELVRPSEAVVNHRSSVLSKMRSALTNPDLSMALARRFSLRRQQDFHQSLRTKSILYRSVAHPLFEMVVVGMIVLNAAVMAAEAQYEGFDLAVLTRHESADGVSSNVWPHGEEVFEACDLAFGLFFSLEVSLKIAALLSDFVRDLWNWMDLAVVLIWVISRLDKFMSVNVQMLRLARLVRLLRLIRLFRYLNNSGFDSLYVISTSLQGSMSILLWSFMMLTIVHVMLALVVNQALHVWYFEEDYAEEQTVVFEYFGSFSRSLLTMFEFSLANWTPPARVLMENVHEALFVYSIVHKMVLGFAVVGVVNGVFIQETFKAATMDDAIMVRQGQRRERTHVMKMKRLFVEADTDHDGAVDRDEWLKVCKDPWVQIWLKSQDFDVRDPIRLFTALDDGDGRLTAEELIEGTARMKGQASPMAMVRLLKEVRNDLKRIEAAAAASAPQAPRVSPRSTPQGPSSLYS